MQLSQDDQSTASNWGRWGDEDDLGALNLIDPATLLRAGASVARGRMYSLAYPIDEATPRTERRHPAWHTTTVRHSERSGRGSADDLLIMQTHTGTHIDALCHYWGSEGLYNGVSPKEIGPEGSPRLSIDKVAGIVTRALMLDLSSSCPTGEAGWGHVIGVAEIEGEIGRLGTTCLPGDAIIIRTGWGRLMPADSKTYNWGEPGVGMEAARWLADHDVVLVGADNWGVESVPPETKGQGLSVHQLLLNRFGVYLVENLYLEEIGNVEGSCVGLLAIAPLRVKSAVGSPVNPLMVV